MDWTNKLRIALCAVLCGLLSACSVSYKFNGASIDYSKTKTIQIADFPIRSNYVWGPMGPMFNNQLKDQFANHTRLQQVKRNGDLKLEGEITRYEQRNKSVSAEGYSAQTELSITVNVRFTNNVNHSEDFEQRGLRTAVHGPVELRYNPIAQLRSGRACYTDDQGHLRPDIQRHRGQLVREEGDSRTDKTP